MNKTPAEAIARSTLVVIPAFNEREQVASVVQSVRSFNPDFDVAVVDDGSSDGTARLARQAGAAVLPLAYNLGYGGALQTGYLYALRSGYEHVVQIDGDGQHDPRYIPVLIDPLRSGKADIVLGTRFRGEGSYRPAAMRRLGMAFFRSVTRLFTGLQITDTTSGYQALNRRALELFSSRLFPVDFPDADVLIMAHRAGLRLVEVPVRMLVGATGRSMHAGARWIYYLFKMTLSIVVTMLRRDPLKGGRP